MAGGTARIIQISEPRHLDPAAMGNSWAINSFLGNALYGTLMTNDTKTGVVQFQMAKSFTTSDGGATFELKLRSGLTFSDGSPLDAEAVKFNWDRARDPKTGSSSLQEASMVASTKVVDATTLKVTMVEPVPSYAQAVLTTTMNWIASPKALKAGNQRFDRNPVGAGPFTLKQWTRQDTIELAKNPDYWDAPKPYLDRITLRSTQDSTQRINTLISGGADVAIDTNWQTLDKARDAGLQTDTMSLNGGQYLALNARRAPFNDVRARKAVAAALDIRAVDDAIYNGTGKIADTLFTKSSPFYSETKLTKQDKKTAQKLFDELAAEGKPVSFTFTSFPAPESKGTAESVQAQLSAFKNVDVKVDFVDISKATELYTTNDFDMVISSALFTDPEPRLWTVFHGDSQVNRSGLDDNELNQALEAGRTATKQQERKAAYEAVQKRLVELVPAIFLGRAAPSAVTAKNVHGVRQYGQGSLLPEELWMQK
ncbi:ABC transporter substrate-binding protein [Streptomyces himalayensis]|uniref:ABC transporter substrate-binding protein n=1 Tax=Streptomyces himalayensis TaxID=2820085 RepID=UPI001C69D3EC|nr:ABC transporter substrate-binding protein [Streptomyces himalayensis]